ncbi:hypothetical protein TDB9533_03570 [Thalassocella blandensis]|nr:hypothetical protein TDB9533_03570 [Thalassocella blandensis]
MKKLLKNREAAAYLGFQHGTLSNSRTSGFLAGVKAPPYKKIGHTVRYDLDDLDAWLSQFDTQTNTSESAARA